MLRRLHWKLTVFNTAITGAILLGMTLLCLFLSEGNTRAQTERIFSEKRQAVISYLESQDRISAAWLRKMESGGETTISIRDGGRPLYSVGLTGDRLEAEIRRAREYAGQVYGLDGETGRTGGSCSFALTGENGERYYAGVSLIPKNGAVLELTLLYSLARTERSIRQQRTTVCAAAALAIGLLAGFSWLFTRKLLQPIQENQRRQTQFVAAASHELRTPLAAILMAASTLERAEPGQRAQFSDIITREGQRMTRLLEELLTLASSDSKSWHLQRERVELDMLVLSVYETYEPLAGEKGLKLELSLPRQNLPALLLDKDSIVQALTILLDNALSYTPAPGTVDLKLTWRRNRARIIVSDTGPGVPDGEKQRIFERFYRGEESRSSRHFGLGLSIAAEIARRHQGRLWVEDAPTGGAAFVLELPLECL